MVSSVCSGMLDELWAKQWRCPWSPWEMLKGSSGSVIYYYYYICYYLFYCTNCIFSKKNERKLFKSQFKLTLFVYRIIHSPQKALTTRWVAKRFGADIHGLWLKMWFSGIFFAQREGYLANTFQLPTRHLMGLMVALCILEIRAGWLKDQQRHKPTDQLFHIYSFNQLPANIYM